MSGSSPAKGGYASPPAPAPCMDFDSLSVEQKLENVKRARPDLWKHCGAAWETWLDQFETDKDKGLALLLLRHLRILDIHDVRMACWSMHKWLLEQDGVDLKKVAFTSFAYGKSGALTQYFYRTSNWLHYAKNIPFNAIHDPSTADDHPARKRLDDPDILVFIDDFLGAGTEAANYFALLKKNGSFDRWKKIYFFVVVGFAEGIEKLRREHPHVIVHANEVVHKVFSDASNTLSSTQKEDCKEFLTRYHHKVYPNKEQDPVKGNPKATPFGYHDGQAMIGFFYNTQSNTLPIFWSVYNGWIPLFQRFDSYNVPEAGTSKHGGHGYDAEVTRKNNQRRGKALLRIGRFLADSQTASSAEDAFRRLDVNGDGVLTAEEFTGAFQCIGCLSDEEVAFLMETYSDESGNVHYKEFLSMSTDSK